MKRSGGRLFRGLLYKFPSEARPEEEKWKFLCTISYSSTDLWTNIEKLREIINPGFYYFVFLIDIVFRFAISVSNVPLHIPGDLWEVGGGNNLSVILLVGVSRSKIILLN